MAGVLTWAIVTLALGLALPAVVLLIECLASLFPLRDMRTKPGADESVAVLIPAHDESGSIGDTVHSLLPELRPQDRLLVVADNCTDDTAALARDAGAAVAERTDPDNRGKGYALRFGVERLGADPPDVVIVVDADCRLSEGSIATLAGQALSLRRPVQGEYTFAPPARTPLTMVSTLALLVRNRARPRGLRALGLPCQLTGSGMAFPWELMRDAPELRAHLVEDLLLGHELAIAGAPPFHSVEAQVTSALPEQRSAAMQQRTRWEHGHLTTLLTHGPRLLRLGLMRFDVGLIALGADLMVPPLALLTGAAVLSAAVACVPMLLGGAPTALYASGSVLAMIAVAVGASWLAHARRQVPLRYLLAAPLYLLWKVPLYLSFMAGRRERQWRRTER